MRAMILAAGRGERMRPLTDIVPKPLLRVAGLPLVEHHIRRLASAGCRDLIINASHLAEQLIAYCGDGSDWGVSIRWSTEDHPLETAGGIAQALPLLGEEPFLVVNGDVWTDYPFGELLDQQLSPSCSAHLVLVDNPPHHPLGDFLLAVDHRVSARQGDASGLTYAGLGVFDPGFFADLEPGALALRPLLDAAIERSGLTGEYYGGDWEDVGTPQRLRELDSRIRTKG